MFVRFFILFTPFVLFWFEQPFVTQDAGIIAYYGAMCQVGWLFLFADTRQFGFYGITFLLVCCVVRVYSEGDLRPPLLSVSLAVALTP